MISAPATTFKTTVPPPANDSPVEVSVVIPCLNEEETLQRCIQKALESFAKLAVRGEVVVSDNGSTDRSREIAERSGARVILQHLKGYGHALRAGIEAARGKFVIMGDADDSYDFGNIGHFINKLRQGYDLVMGCRLPSGGGVIMPGAMPWLHRWLGNPVLSKIGRLFFKSNITDFHCGLRAFTKEAYQQMKLNTTGMEFASEMVIKATLLNQRITNVPITLYKDGRSRPPHLRSWRDGWRHLRFMLLYSPRWLFLYPALALLLFGLIVMSLLLPGPLKIGGVVFDTNTLMIGAMSVILGVQILAFAISSRIFAQTEGFLPDDPRLQRWIKNFNLEVGLVIGGAMTLLGLIAIVLTVVWWGQLRFGDLPRPTVLRVMIPGVTLVVVGMQIIFSSFFISFLTLERR
jgi:glycosyltransferase involved in cell wall biosynthesis